LHLGNLTTLVLDYLDINIYPTHSDILGLLQGTPRLQTLALQFLEQLPKESDISQPGIVVELRALTRLSLCGDRMQLSSGRNSQLDQASCYIPSTPQRVGNIHTPVDHRHGLPRPCYLPPF